MFEQGAGEGKGTVQEGEGDASKKHEEGRLTLPVPNSLSLLALVEGEKNEGEDSRDDDNGDEEPEDGFETVLVEGSLVGGEEQGSDDVPDGRSDLVERDHDALLGLSSDVGREPADDEGVAGEEETVKEKKRTTIKKCR